MTHSRLSLAELHQVLLVTVATSGMRHDLRNKLSSLRNATYFLKRKLDGQPVWRDDVRVPRFFQIMESELAAADQIMSSGMSEVLSEPQSERVDVAAVVRAALDMRPAPAGVALSSEIAPSQHQVLAAGDELSVAIRCLVDNAVEAVVPAGGGAVVVRWAPFHAGFSVIEVVDDGPGFERGDPVPWLAPFASTKPGHLGLGLAVVRRVASRAGGTLELTTPGRGVRAAIAVPAASAEKEAPRAERTHPAGR